MPIYSYVCECGNKFDRIVQPDTAEMPCEQCGRPAKRGGLELPARRNPEHGIQR